MPRAQAEAFALWCCAIAPEQLDELVSCLSVESEAMVHAYGVRVKGWPASMRRAEWFVRFGSSQKAGREANALPLLLSRRLKEAPFLERDRSISRSGRRQTLDG